MGTQILINNKDISEYGLIALDGTLNAIMTPATHKELSKNDNSSINGMNYVLGVERRYKERVVNIPFLLRANSLEEQQTKLESLAAVLDDGIKKDGVPTNVNKVSVPILNKNYYMLFNDYNAFSNFGIDGYCRVNIKFTEINPKNRDSYVN